MSVEREEVLKKIMEILRDVFGDDSLVITEESVMMDIEGWDSLTHLLFLNEVEEAFGVEFTLDEVKGTKKFEELVNVLMK